MLESRAYVVVVKFLGRAKPPRSVSQDVNKSSIRRKSVNDERREASAGHTSSDFKPPGEGNQRCIRVDNSNWRQLKTPFPLSHSLSLSLLSLGHNKRYTRPFPSVSSNLVKFFFFFTHSPTISLHRYR